MLKKIEDEVQQLIVSKHLLNFILFFSLLFLRWSIRHDILMIEIQRLRNLIPRLWKISIGRKSMSVSYKKLWKLLIDRDMKKKDLCVAAGISHTSMAKLGK